LSPRLAVLLHISLDARARETVLSAAQFASL
jgi:hypothetical protein